MSATASAPATETREWYCGHCRDTVTGGPFVPAGWLQVRRYRGDAEPPARVGIYCSAWCAHHALRRLAETEVR